MVIFSICLILLVMIGVGIGKLHYSIHMWRKRRRLRLHGTDAVKKMFN